MNKVNRSRSCAGHGVRLAENKRQGNKATVSTKAGEGEGLLNPVRGQKLDARKLIEAAVLLFTGH